MNEEYFTFHLQYKHSGTFANRKCEERFLPPKSENVRPHSSNSIENATLYRHRNDPHHRNDLRHRNDPQSPPKWYLFAIEMIPS